MTDDEKRVVIDKIIREAMRHTVVGKLEFTTPNPSAEDIIRWQDGGYLTTRAISEMPPQPLDLHFEARDLRRTNNND